MLSKVDMLIVDGWRKLGFFYDLDGRIETNQWRFYGSKKGLWNWVLILEEYTNNPDLKGISAEKHYGPYFFEIMTWDKAKISRHCIAGSIADLKKLKDIISKNLQQKGPGETFNIDEEYGIDNELTAKFFIMTDDFDPASMDELVFSDRQKYVNEKLQK